MEDQKLYALPDLPYAYDALAPYMSKDLVTLHHDKHHAAYVNGANAILQRLDKVKADEADFDTKATYKEMSFHIGGHLLHYIFWENLAPAGKGGGGAPAGALAQLLDREYGSFGRFKKVFSQAAASVEGSGWATLTFCKLTNRPIIMQIEKHNVNIYPMFRILMALDVWEHAYYLDYKNDRAKFIEAYWNIVNWGAVSKSLEEVL
ncbi:MAG: superoxide dismutase [Syntrophorhabdaceae bacterium]|nr:superoxide dismutase [Syntrophorhabdaceae bacterium]